MSFNTDETWKCLRDQHDAIIQYLESIFPEYIQNQEQDFDEKGKKLPIFTERSKSQIKHYFNAICTDAFGKSFKKLREDGELKGDPSEISKTVKRLNYFLKTFCQNQDIHSEYPIQVYSFHLLSTRKKKRCIHFACAKAETFGKGQSYSYDNISLDRALNSQKGDSSKKDIYIKEDLGNVPIIKLLHAVPPDPKFVGRHNEIEYLNAVWCSNKINLISIVAWGGFGKSLLVRQWLEELDIHSPDSYKPEKVLWWSFYQNNSVDAFLETALSCFSSRPQECRRVPPIDEGFDTLISLLGKGLSILVLDGFEEMQYSQAGDYFGKCNNYQLANFIRRICEGDCSSCLCVVTSRIHITDTASFEGSCAKINLEDLPLLPKESRLLLRNHGVVGTDKQLDEIIADHGCHPLALVTIATLLSNFFKGNAERSKDMPPVVIPDSVIGDRFKLWRTFSWYDALLNDKERHVLRIISLFRHISPWKLLVSAFQKNTLKKQTSQITLEVELKAITTHLNQLQLIRFDASLNAFSMHPLWKAFFEILMSEADTNNFHKLLFKLLQTESPYRPNTLNQMWPLIEAVYHGCKCGRSKKSLTIFRDRIERKEGFLTKNLAAWGTKVDLCSMFFSSKNFSGQCYLDDLEEQGHLLNAAGFAYMNLGLPTKAIDLFDRAVIVYKNASLDNDESQVHRNRADAFLRTGHIEDAKIAASTALELDHSPKSQQSSLGYIGYAYSLLGSFDQATLAFDKALKIFGEKWLPPTRGIQLVEMLIMKGQYEDAYNKCKKMLTWTKIQKILFSEAECNRVLGIVLSEIACTSKDSRIAQKSINILRKAVKLSSRAGVHFYAIRTELDFIRVSLVLTINDLNNLKKSNLENINRQINEVLRISEESDYNLIKAETFFTKACLHLITDNMIQCREELKNSLELAHQLKYSWLEDKCFQLQKRL